MVRRKSKWRQRSNSTVTGLHPSICSTRSQNLLLARQAEPYCCSCCSVEIPVVGIAESATWQLGWWCIPLRQAMHVHPRQEHYRASRPTPRLPTTRNQTILTWGTAMPSQAIFFGLSSKLLVSSLMAAFSLPYSAGHLLLAYTPSPRSCNCPCRPSSTHLAAAADEAPIGHHERRSCQQPPPSRSGWSADEDGE
jgi:hypothetical protein